MFSWVGGWEGWVFICSFVSAIVLTRSFESVCALPFSVSFLLVSFGHLSSRVVVGAVFDPVCFA